MKQILREYKIKKMSALLIAIALVLNMVVLSVPIIAANIGGGQAAFTDVTLEIGGVVVDPNTSQPINQTETFDLNYKFVVTSGSAITAGDTITTTLPAIFVVANDIVDLNINTGGATIGTFTLLKADKTLTITFNDNVKNSEVWNGNVVITTKIDQTLIATGPNPRTETFAIQGAVTKDVVMKFAPTANSTAIEKSGLANKAVNPTAINWKVQMNKQLKPQTNLGISDVIPANLTVDMGTIVVKELLVSPNGTVTNGAIVDPSAYTKTYDSGTRQLSVVVQGNTSSAYEVTYETSIDDINVTTFTNTAVLSVGGSASATVGITRGDKLSKAGVMNRNFNPEYMTWTIDVNKYQGTITGAAITDHIPAGLTYNASTPASLYLLTLNDDGSVATQTLQGSNLLTVDSTNPNDVILSFNIGDTSNAYKIVYETTIDERINKTYTNSATLTSTSDPDITKTKSLTANFGTTISKSAATTINYSTKAIDWTIKANEVESTITGGVIVDVLPLGVTYDPTSLVIVKQIYDYNQNKFVDGAILTTTGAITYATSVTTGSSLSIDLDTLATNNTAGVLDYAIKVTYRTNIDQNGAGSYNETYGTGIKNGATLTGTTGVGPNNSSIATSNPSIKNTITKSIGTAGIDYANNTIAWKVDIKPIKEPMKELIITDTFTNGGLKYNVGSLVITDGTTTLTPGAAYTVTSKDGDYNIGFVVNFGATDIQNKQYTMTYTTTFIPGTHTVSAASTSYINKASAVWTELSTGITTNSSISSKTATISTTARDNGNKSGVLNRVEKNIDWTINVNYRSDNLIDYTVVDLIPPSEQDNQAYIHLPELNTIKVYNYSVTSNGAMILGSVLDPASYEVTEESDAGFKLKFLGTITTPYRIVYKTKLINDSLSEYNNGVTIGAIGLSASVAYSNSNVFVSKNSPVSGTTLDWSVNVNTSLSTINNAVLTDSLSYGHEYDKTSLKVYKVTTAGSILVDSSKYTATYKVTNFATGEQEFKLAFNETIVDEYIINYKTKVFVTTNTTITNSAQFAGDGVKVYNDSTNKSVAIEVTSAYSSALAAREAADPKGDLTITKVDSENNTIKLSGVVYDLLDSNKNVIATLAATDALGKTKALRLEREIYYLVEKVAPTGYQLPYPNLIPVDMTDGSDVNLPLENSKTRTLVLEKVARYNTGTKLAGAVFDLYGPIGKTTATSVRLTTDVNGLATFNNVLFGDYTLTEVTEPAGYEVINRVTNVTINSSKLVFNVTIENQKRSYISPTVPTTPIDPDKPVIPITPIKPTTPVVPGTPTTPGTPTVPGKSEEVTVKDTPVNGTIKVPVNSDVNIVKDPVNGVVTVDINGKWEYKPNPGFIGNDSFTIMVKDPDGDEEEFEIDIFVEEIPEGILELPETGGLGVELFGLVGVSLIGTGLVLRRRKKQ